MKDLFAVHLNAGNDKNGNPRRLFVVYNTYSGAIVETIDEGYGGTRSLTSKYPDIICSSRIETTPKEYKDLKSYFKDYVTKNP
jgi:hypothetical protein